MTELHTLDDLDRGDVVRMQRAPNHKWQEFLLREVNDDGTFELIDRKNGAMRTISPTRFAFQVRRHGPRGAVVWVPIEVPG